MLLKASSNNGPCTTEKKSSSEKHWYHSILQREDLKTQMSLIHW